MNATLAHARSTIAEDLDYLRACLKANPAQVSFFKTKFIHEGKRVHISPLEVAVLFGSVDSMLEFFQEIKNTPHAKATPEFVLANLLFLQEEKISVHTAKSISPTSISNIFHQGVYGASETPDLFECLVLKKDVASADNTQQIDALWKTVVSLCPPKERHQRLFMSVAGREIRNGGLRDTAAYIAGLLRHLPDTCLLEEIAAAQKTKKA